MNLIRATPTAIIIESANITPPLAIIIIIVLVDYS